MKRVLISMAFVAFLFEATGLPALIASDPCEQACPDDAPHDKCPPFCGCIACAVHSVQSVVAALVVVSPAAVVKQHGPVLDESAPLSAEAGDILHVPRFSPV